MISVVILTKNEEENIKECLETVSFADEIVVVDDYSEDKTRKIAKDFGAKVFKRKLNSDFAAQRNFGMDKATKSWILFVDADERVTESLKTEIIQAINNPFVRKEGFYIRRHDFMWGKRLKHGEIGSVKLLRLALKGSGKWVRRVHEEWRVVGRVGTLNNPIHHCPHPSLKEFLSDINKMSSLHAQANKEEGKRPSLLRIVIWPFGHLFVKFFLKRGFLDGTRGFVVALVMSFHSFLAWSKLWILQRS